MSSTDGDGPSRGSCCWTQCLCILTRRRGTALLARDDEFCIFYSVLVPQSKYSGHGEKEDVVAVSDTFDAR